MDQKQISEKYNLTESQVQTLVGAFQKEAPKVHNILFYYSPQHINTSTAHHTTSPPSTTHIPLVPLSYHHFTHHHSNSLLLKLQGKIDKSHFVKIIAAVRKTHPELAVFDDEIVGLVFTFCDTYPNEMVRGRENSERVI